MASVANEFVQLVHVHEILVAPHAGEIVGSVLLVSRFSVIAVIIFVIYMNTTAKIGTIIEISKSFARNLYFPPQ